MDFMTFFGKNTNIILTDKLSYLLIIIVIVKLLS